MTFRVNMLDHQRGWGKQREMIDALTQAVLEAKERAAERVLARVPVLEALSWTETVGGALSFAEHSNRYIELRVQDTPVWRLTIEARGYVLTLRERWLVEGYGTNAPVPAEA